MSRGRARHHSSRRRAYSVRQREVRERRVRAARDDADWMAGDFDSVAPEAVSEPTRPAWGLPLPGRPIAA